MTGKTKPAARASAAGSIIIGAHSGQAARTEYALGGPARQAATARLAYLRTLADIVSLGASEAPNAESRERLSAATAAIFDAAAIERRALLCGRRA